MDYSDDIYDRDLIEDVKGVFKVFVLFIPLPFFWALFDQQGSRWTLQATLMDGEILGYYIKPDMLQFFNPLFIVIFIPIFQMWVYPVIENYLYIRTPLRKMATGGFLAAFTFVISALLQYQLNVGLIILVPQ